MFRMNAVPLLDWLRLADYDEALRYARIGVIKRFARGNVSFQNGNLIDDAALDELRAVGDRAIADLQFNLAAILSDDRNHRLRHDAHSNSP
mgnify:CR=1 FL=1